MLNGNRTKSNRGRSPRDLYITPEELAMAATVELDLDEYPHRRFISGLDAGCGTGVWGRAMSNLQFTSLEGIDIRPDIFANLQFYDRIHQGDFLDFRSVLGYDVIFGNPPYLLAEEFIRHSFDLLNKDGYIYFLLRLSFLEGIDRGDNLFKMYPPKRIYVSSRRPSFFSTGGRHTTDTLAYAMFLWKKDYQGKTELGFLDWKYLK
jgi:SAM-dependent methyltransferase